MQCPATSRIGNQGIPRGSKPTFFHFVNSRDPEVCNFPTLEKAPAELSTQCGKNMNNSVSPDLPSVRVGLDNLALPNNLSLT